MLTIDELTSIAQAHLADAEILLTNGRPDGARYLCGYAVEIALKARIVKTLDWEGFPPVGGDFADLRYLKTHNLVVLLKLSGWERRIRTDFKQQWSLISAWTPESRYHLPGAVTLEDAKLMVDAAKVLVQKLLE